MRITVLVLEYLNIILLNARAFDDSEVHFDRFEREHGVPNGLEARDGRQSGGSLLGCLMGCTRELRVIICA